MSFTSVVEQHMQISVRTGDEWMVRCPYHDNSSFTMQINVDKGLFVCFSCGVGGSIKRMAKDMHWGWEDGGEDDLADLRKKLDLLRKNDPAPRDIVLPESRLKRYQFPTDYWTGRGFTQDTIDAFDLGYDMMNNHVTIPVRNTRGELLGVIRRDLDWADEDDDDYTPKYRYPKAFRRRAHLFAEWLVAEDDRDTLVLVEGSVDSMMVWQAGFMSGAIYGSSVTDEQRVLLRKLGVERIVLFFDNDVAGRKATMGALGFKVHVRKGKKEYEYNPALDLRRQFDVRKVIYRKMPSDPGACTSDQIRRAVVTALEHDVLSDLTVALR